jgi:hypothetical protein
MDMAKPSKAPEQKVIQINIANDVPAFRWQMVFNAFWLESTGMGQILRVAFMNGDTATEIVPIVLAEDAIHMFKTSSAEYVKAFGSMTAEEVDDVEMPKAKQFSPFFSNFIRPAIAGKVGEIGLFSLPLHHIADLAKGTVPPETAIHPVQVALLYSDLPTHRRLVLDLFSCVS